MSVIEFKPGPGEPARNSEESEEKLQRLRLRAQTDLMWLANEVLGYDFQENPHRGLVKCYLQCDQEHCSCGHRLDRHENKHSAFSVQPSADHFPQGRCTETGCSCNAGRKKTLPELDPKVKRRLILWPRGHFKTSMAAAAAVQLILNFPDIRIMILAGDLKESKKRLLEIKGHFENWGKDGKLQKLFPEFCSKIQGRRMGNSREFISPARQRKNLREGTLVVFSPKVLSTGTHFDVALIDDLVNQLNSRKAEGLQKSIDDFKAILPVIDPEGFIFASGTRYDFSDAYGWMQEQIEKEGLDNWLVSIRTCWKTRCKNPGCDHADFRHLDGGGRCWVEGCQCQHFESNGIREVLFPQVRTEDGRMIGFTEQILDNLLKELKEYPFGCQYENNPLVKSEQKFTEELLYSKVKHPIEVPKRGPIVLQIDIATGQDSRDDDMVIMASRIRNGRHHIIDCVSGHIPEDRQPVVICDLIQKYGPRVIFIEKKTGAGYLEVLIRLEAQRRKMPNLPQIELRSASNVKGAKEMRIGALLGYITQDRVWFMLGLPNWQKLEEQLLLFPRFKGHDDHADCLGLLLEAPTGFEYEALPEAQVPFFLRQPKEMQIPREHDGMPFGLNG